MQNGSNDNYVLVLSGLYMQLIYCKTLFSKRLVKLMKSQGLLSANQTGCLKTETQWEEPTIKSVSASQSVRLILSREPKRRANSYNSVNHIKVCRKFNLFSKITRKIFNYRWVCRKRFVKSSQKNFYDLEMSLNLNTIRNKYRYLAPE
jgi:hypothetical protein